MKKTKTEPEEEVRKVGKPAIKDEFSDLPISRQAKYQLRKRKQKKCATCGATCVGVYCTKHARKRREMAREKLPEPTRYAKKRRLKGARSYQKAEKV